jgi:nuclear GTP-binding protein
MVSRKQNAAFGPSLKAKRQAPKKLTGAGGPLRDTATINRLLMYKGKVKRDKKTGEIVRGYVTPKSQQHEKGGMARVQPDRKWFGNTRVIGQKQMETFREELQKKIRDPYTVLMKQAKLPMSLLKEPEETRLKIKNRINFAETFGPKKQRKRVKLTSDGAGDYGELVQKAEEKEVTYNPAKDSAFLKDQSNWYKSILYDPIMERGQSKRVWGELYKVIDSSDVLVQVLDARDPMGTRTPHIEAYLKKEKAHKHLVFVLNKCDLVPTWATVRWVKVLSAEYPTIAFHASITNPFGKGSLIQLLRQFAQIHRDKKSISVGMFGYPNVGKSSVINTLRKKKVSKVSPVPGETKVWQYVALMRRIFLIDCPGVVHNANKDTPSDIVLKSVVRTENLEDATEHVAEILRRVKKEYVQRHYRIIQWKDHYDFLDQLARKSGKLLKGNKPDYSAVSRRVLFDWQRGRLPWFVAPPFEDQIDAREMADLRDQLRIKQLFYNIKLADEVAFTKHDRHGVGYIPDEKQGEILKEVIKPIKVLKKVEKKVSSSESAEEDQEEVDWDEVYKSVKGKLLDQEPDKDEKGEYIPREEDDEESEEEENDEQDDEQVDEEEFDFNVGGDNQDEEEEEEEQAEEEVKKTPSKKETTVAGRTKRVLSKQAEILDRKKNKKMDDKLKKRKASDMTKDKEEDNTPAYVPKSLRNLLKKRSK